MIVDTIILLLALVLMAGGLWLLWNVSMQAFEDWRAGR